MSSDARNMLSRQESLNKMSKDVSREYNTPRNMLRRQESIGKSNGEQKDRKAWTKQQMRNKRTETWLGDRKAWTAWQRRCLKYSTCRGPV